MDISVYTFEDSDGEESGTFQTQDIKEAEEYAKKYKLRIIEHVYEWQEAVPVQWADFTEKDE